MFQEIDRKKKEIDALCSAKCDLAGQIKEYYRIMLTYTGSALEGSTLTENEIKILLEQGIQTGQKSDWDYYEAEGHAAAYDYIYTIGKDGYLGEEHIKTLHRLLYSRVDAAIGDEQGGLYRQERIRLTASKYNPPVPEEIAALMADFAHWLGQQEDKLHPVEFAVQAHKKLIFIHPFIDGNRRVARLLMNLCLIRKGYSIAVIEPAVRDAYVTLLEKAHEDDRPFVNFIAEQVEKSQRKLISLANSGYFSGETR